MALRFLAGALGAAAAAGAGWRMGWLTAGAAVAAFAVGTLVFGFRGWAGAVPLLVFFCTATLLGRVPGRPRHGARNARQVAANGGVAAAAALAAGLGASWAPAAFGGALAAACGDTWATEIGRRWGGTARRLGFGPPAPDGASGGMTAIGTLGGAAGAALIALAAGGAAALAGGVAGLLADSALGATVQGVYSCTACGTGTESRAEPACSCAAPLRRVRGWGAMDNDAVNLAATVVGAAVAAAVHAAAAPR